MDSTEAKKVEANKLFQAGQYAAAVGIYSSILDKSTYPIAQQLRATVLSNRAACYLKLNKYDKCVTDCQRCLEVCDQHQQNQKGKCPFKKLRAKALFRRAEARIARGELQEAVDDYEELLRTSKKKNKTVARRYKTLLQQLPDRQTAKDTVTHAPANIKCISETNRQLSPGLQSFFGDKHIPLAVVRPAFPSALVITTLVITASSVFFPPTFSKH